MNASDSQVSQQSFKTEQGVVDDIGEISVVDAENVQLLSSQGWKLLKVVSSQSVETLSRNFPFCPDGQNYAQSYQYNDQAVVQRSKFVMGKPGRILKDEMQAHIGQLTKELHAEKDEHTQAKRSLSELGTDCIKRQQDIDRFKGELKVMTERFEKMSAVYDDTKKKFEALQQATLQTLVKLPGGNEVSIDAAGKMVRAGEIMGGDAGSDVPF